MAHSLVPNRHIELVVGTETFTVSGIALGRSSTLHDWSNGSIPKSVEKGGAVDFSHHDVEVVRTVVAYLETGSTLPVSRDRDPTFYVKLYKLAGSLGINEEFLTACLNQLRSQRYDIKTLLEIMYHTAGAKLTEDPGIMGWMTQQITEDMEKLEESQIFRDVVEAGGEGSWRIQSVMMASLKYRNKQLHEMGSFHVLQQPTPSSSPPQPSLNRSQYASMPSRRLKDVFNVHLGEKPLRSSQQVLVESRKSKAGKRNLNATVEDAPLSDEEIDTRTSSDRPKKSRHSL